MKKKSIGRLVLSGLVTFTLASCVTESTTAPAAPDGVSSTAAQTGEVVVQSAPMYTTEITFQDPQALARIPVIVEGRDDYVEWPGYVQSIGPDAALRIYSSRGPLPAPTRNDTGGFRITWDNTCWRPDGRLGLRLFTYCVSLPSNLNRYHESWLGKDWLGAYAYSTTTGSMKTFRVSKIRVKGVHPVQFSYKTFQNEWRSLVLNPGYRDLSTLPTLREFHIRAASNRFSDSYSLDDIRIHYTP